jgi:hypothetical protein
MLHRQALKECVYAEMLCSVVVVDILCRLWWFDEGVRVCRDALQCGDGDGV